MTNVNKHGVDYSAIEIGDLVKLDMGFDGTILGYVTRVTDSKLHAIWSDDFEEWFEHFSTGKICGHWKVVVHEPKKLVPTKPYEQLVAYDWCHTGEIIWGVFSHMVGDKVFAHWSNRYPCRQTHHTEFMEINRIIAVEDIIIHEPKEQNIPVAQELSVHQESANFAHAAVQGIINAHAEKNSEEKPEKLLLEDYYRGFDDGVEHAKNDGVVFNFKDFDLSVRRTWKKQNFKDAVSNAALGLTCEAGEVADLIKKAIYHGRGFDSVNSKEYLDSMNIKSIRYEDVKDELSDILFYVSAMAQEFGFTLEDIAKHNREKLEKRFPDGFSTEASAQKKDKYSKIERKELKKGDKLIVTGDREDNPLGWGVRHMIPSGTDVEFAWYDFEGHIVVRRPDGGVNTVHKDDLKEVTD
ncbi:nucleoside triphosphate pyrophosphohydrolase family protein [Bacillus cereus]|nr:nucleoside triphosphate pyrophosphohydrolase family protein [Bacillus cereus]MBJ8023726.1 nucleoside triphosphate pyrophosphohydrolase family protein [Bacillus cereus]